MCAPHNAVKYDTASPPELKVLSQDAQDQNDIVSLLELTEVHNKGIDGSGKRLAIIESAYYTSHKSMDGIKKEPVGLGCGTADHGTSLKH